MKASVLYDLNYSNAPSYDFRQIYTFLFYLKLSIKSTFISNFFVGCHKKKNVDTEKLNN